MADTDKKFLDEDGVSQFAEETKKYVDNHADNADIHVTADDKENWDGKQEALTSEQLAAVNSGINATDKLNYDAHVANDDIHVTTDNKDNWDGKQDALTSQQIDNINDVVNKANDADVIHKSGNETVNGTKTFTVAPVSSNDATTNGFFIKTTAIARNDVPTTIYRSTFRVNDKNNQILGEYCVEKSNSGSSLLNMNVRTEKDDGTQISKSLYLNLRNDGSDVSFYPSTNNEFSLGTSTSKWKDVNTVLLNGKTPAYASDLANYLPLSGGQMTGRMISRNTNSEYVGLYGGSAWNTGASCALWGKDHPEYLGRFRLSAHDGTNYAELLGKPTGELTWEGKSVDVIEEQGGGYIRYSNGIQICWGTLVTQTQLMPITFAKPFLSVTSYGITALGSTATKVWLSGERLATNVTLSTDSPDGSHRRVDWVAIGVWK